MTPITTLPMSQVGQGMRMMQGGKHMGKIVIEAIEDDVVEVSNRAHSFQNASIG